MPGDQRTVLAVEIEASEDELWALAQFVKRVGWSEFISNAVDKDEAYEIRAGVDALQRGLARVGYAPR